MVDWTYPIERSPMLRLSKDRKVTNSVTSTGKANVKNSFGLPAGISCPGMTSFCKSICYAGRMERLPNLTSLRNVVQDNFATLLYADYLGGIRGMVHEIMPLMNEFMTESNKRNAPLNFRIHWDGDFFSIDYAYAWAMIARAYPEINFWVYTRSFTPEINVLPYITNIPNINVYLSADPVNVKLAKEMAALYGLPIAMVDRDFEAGNDILESAGKVVKCPENGGRLELISEKGSACARCKWCIFGKGDVLFSVTKT